MLRWLTIKHFIVFIPITSADKHRLNATRFSLAIIRLEGRTDRIRDGQPRMTISKGFK
jgi:hypothetical protein